MQPPSVIAINKSDALLQVAQLQADALRQETAKPQRRLQIVGLAGSGKTYSTITTMPKPIVLDYDNQLNDPLVREKAHAIFPMWNQDFVKSELKLTGNPAQILESLVQKLGADLTTDYSIIFDSASMISDVFKNNLEEYMKAQKITDGYWLWAEWARWWKKIFTAFRSLKCHGAFLFHETEIRDEETGRLEKFSWALQGKEFTHRIPTFCTDVIRQIREVKLTADKKSVESERFYWQIKPTSDFPCAKSRRVTNQILIPASWDELTK